MATTHSISGSITATGTTDATDRVVKADIVLDSFGSATIALEAQMPNGTWTSVEDYTSDTNKVWDSAVGAPLRLNCTSYTSGTINYWINGK